MATVQFEAVVESPKNSGCRGSRLGAVVLAVAVDVDQCRPIVHEPSRNFIVSRRQRCICSSKFVAPTASSLIPDLEYSGSR